MPRKSQAAVLTQQALTRHWIHSHEEDTDIEMVFRPADFHFPPSRGRTGFELKSDGSLIQTGIAPTDGPQESRGTWKLADDQLLLYTKSKTQPARILKIEQVAPDRLVIKK